MKTHYIKRIAAFGLSLIVAASVFGAPQPNQAFKKMDKDGNGRLSAAKITANSLESLQANGKKNGWDKAEIEKRSSGVEKRTAARIKKGDKNGDGELSPEEWAASAPGGNEAKGKEAEAAKGKAKKK